MLNKVFVVLAVIGFTSAIQLNKCFDRWQQRDIDTTSLSGDWLLYETTYKIYKCPHVYVKSTDGRIGKFNITSTEQRPEGWISYTAPGRTSFGEFLVTFPPELNLPNVEFEILNGDPGPLDKWALVMNCIDRDGSVVDRATIIIRPDVDRAEVDEATRDIKEELKEFGLEFTKTDISPEACEGAPEHPRRI